MAKILQFKRALPETKIARVITAENDIEDDISAVVNDYSLTPANRRWILENMLMDMDEQLEAYKKELERAEKKMEGLVRAAEQEIADAYREFNAHVQGMTRSVKKLTKSSRRGETLQAASAPE